MSDSEFKVRLQQSRKAKGWSQAKLAKETGLSQTTISDIERGRNARSRDLIALASALEVSALWLSENKGSRQPSGPHENAPKTPSDPSLVEEINEAEHKLLELYRKANDVGRATVLRVAELEANYIVPPPSEDDGNIKDD